MASSNGIIRQEVEIPESMTGRLVGKRGANIRALQNSSGILSVKLLPSSSSSTTRVAIEGYTEQAVDSIAAQIRNLGLYKPYSYPSKSGFYLTFISHRIGVPMSQCDRRQAYTALLRPVSGEDLHEILSGILMLSSNAPGLRFYLPEYYEDPDSVEPEPLIGLTGADCGKSGSFGRNRVEEGPKTCTVVLDKECEGRQIYEAHLRRSLSEDLGRDLIPSFIVQFGKSVYTDKSSPKFFRPSSSPYDVEDLCSVLGNKLTNMFSSACPRSSVDNLRNLLAEEGRYWKSDQVLKKTDVHLMDLDRNKPYMLSIGHKAEIESSSLQADTAILEEDPRKKSYLGKFQQGKQRLGLIGFTGNWLDVDFRLRIHGKSMEEVPQELLQKMEEAWDRRTPDGMLVFASGRKFRVVNARHKELESFCSNDFCLKIMKVVMSSDAGNAAAPPKLEVSLRSRKIKELLRSSDSSQSRPWLKGDGTYGLLESCIHDLVDEASRLSLAMGSIL